MKTTVSLAALAAILFVAPARAQQGESRGNDGAPPPAKAAPQDGGDSAPARSEGKLYLKLKKGGEVVFKPGEAEPGKPRTKPAFKGYTKKGLEAYQRDAEDKRLDKAALGKLEPPKARKAKELAAEAEMNRDVRDTLKEKLEAEKAKGAESAETEKLEAADKAARAVGRSLEEKMKRFEAKEAPGQKVFKGAADSAGNEPSAGGEPSAPSKEGGEAPRR